MSIYTRDGDGGQTRLPGSAPIFKDSPAVEVCGTIDELGAALGLARCQPLPEKMGPLLQSIQQTLLQLNSELADPGQRGDASRAIGPRQIAELEAAIDGYESQLQALRAFILPGTSHAEAALHFARTVCRRAERRVVSLARAEPHRTGEHHLAYLNRLSDLLFVLARYAVAR
ncbi:MAG: cob(I)yrinic acid a,c-diamide adenosyltransferase [Thermoguttaceae bacterium]|jgi:cob(I)alamin adenosyltransferase|nr:cob(I)yrinic acid a,c-diamide adenosyltransferase [Thermoguttaceae bacterium]